MKEIFQNAVFRKLFAAGVTSQLGTTIGNMAFAFYLLDRFADQPVYATLAELMYALPTLAVFFIVGVLADRLDRKKICANTDWIRAGLTVALIGALWVDWIPAAFAILFIRGAVGKFFQPAETALIQGVLKPDQYNQAAGLNQMVFGMFMLFGMGLGAVAYNFLGIYGALIVDGVSFLVSGILIQACRIPLEARLPNGETPIRDIRLNMVIADFKQGFLYIARNKLLIALLSGFFIFGFINGAFSVLPMFMMKYKLAPDQYQLYSSLFAVFFGAGMLPGSMLGSGLIRKFGVISTIVGGLLLNVVFGSVMAFTSNVWVFLGMTTLIGLTIAPVNVAIGGWLPKIIQPTVRGRVNAWMDPIMMLAHSTALGLIALLYPRWITLELVFVGVGLCILVVAVMYALKLPRLARESEEVQEEGSEPGGERQPGLTAEAGAGAGAGAGA